MAKVSFGNVIGITFALVGSILVLYGMHSAAKYRDLNRENDWLVLRSSVEQGYMLDDAWVNSRCEQPGTVAKYLDCTSILDARISVSDDLIKVAKKMKH